jgi:hypothetical protein
MSNNRVLGAFVVGLAIVAGAYTLSNFGNSPSAPTVAQPATVSAAPLRTPITVADTNNDGVEDWRETFVDKNKIVIEEDTSNYEEPTTVTEQFGLSFFQDIVRMKGYQGIGRTEEQILADNIKDLSNYAKDRLLDTRDINIGIDTSAQAVRNYANQHAEIVLLYGKTSGRSEIAVLDELLKTKSPESEEELGVIANAYKNMAEEVLKIEVPPQLVKDHLDLINIYYALHFDILAMQNAIKDPIVGMTRLKRYQDDVNGLIYASENLYKSLIPYASVFERNDSALIFADFNSR